MVYSVARAWLVLVCLLAAGCPGGAERARSSQWRGWEPCAKDGSCHEGFSCRYDRDRDGGLLSRCVPEPGRCRWHTDCTSTQRCVRSGPDSVGVCWERAN